MKRIFVKTAKGATVPNPNNLGDVIDEKGAEVVLTSGIRRLMRDGSLAVAKAEVKPKAAAPKASS